MKNYNLVLAILIIVATTIAVSTDKIQSSDFMLVMTGCVGFLGSQSIDKLSKSGVDDVKS